MDVGCITLPVTKDEMVVLEDCIAVLGVERPTHVTDIYKMRRGRYTSVRIWSKIDLGTCRLTDIFVTDAFMVPIADFEVTNFDLRDEDIKNVTIQDVLGDEPIPVWEPLPEKQKEKEVTLLSIDPFELSEMPEPLLPKTTKNRSFSDLL